MLRGIFEMIPDDMRGFALDFNVIALSEVVSLCDKQVLVRVSIIRAIKLLERRGNMQFQK